MIITFEVTKSGGDRIKISILEDGTIKTDNDGISQPNHQSAEGFLRDVGRLAGGRTEIKLKSAHLHTHTHTHDGVTHTH